MEDLIPRAGRQKSWRAALGERGRVCLHRGPPCDCSGLFLYPQRACADVSCLKGGWGPSPAGNIPARLAAGYAKDESSTQPSVTTKARLNVSASRRLCAAPQKMYIPFSAIRKQAPNGRRESPDGKQL